MGKIKQKRDRSTNSLKNSALHQQLIDDKSVIPTTREKKRRRNLDDEKFVEARTSRKILRTAKEQIDELNEARDEPSEKIACLTNVHSTNYDEDASNDEDEDSDLNAEYLNSYDNDDNDDEQLDEDLKRKLEKFFPSSEDQKIKKSDIIDRLADAISTKRTEICSDTECGKDMTGVKSDLSDEVVALFKKVGRVMQSYRSGPVPKPLKIIPKYRNWEELLDLTEPDKWSAASIFAATRIMVSNLKDNQAAKFMNRVLLPRVRDDIKEFKRVNDHLYEAMIKCMFKSYGFMKGFLLSLCKDGTCTVREATIVSSVLIKSSIKMEHSAAAILEICGLPYSPANCIFLSALIEKKYALPYVVIDELVNYFLRFKRSKDELTVLWHQCLLTFAQRCKCDVSSEQKEAILDLIKTRPHADISPEIRRELTSAECRDVEMDQ